MADNASAPPDGSPPQSPGPAKAVGVPGLVDEYRQQHRAWLDQADELIRLRTQVRIAAEKEATEIITAARRDVRRTLIEARHNLRVLRSQLQAAVEAGNAPPSELAAGPAAAELRAGDLTPYEWPALPEETRSLARNARNDIRAVIDEARAEIEGLLAEPSRQPAEVQGTRFSPDSAPLGGTGAAEETDHGAVSLSMDSDGQHPLAQPRQTERAPVLDPEVLGFPGDGDWLGELRPPVRTADAIRVDTPVAPSSEGETSSPPRFELPGDLVEFRSGVFASPATADADDEEVSRRSRRRNMFAMAAVLSIAGLGAFWWLRPGRAENPSAFSASPPIALASGAPTAPEPEALPPTPPPSELLSLTIEARRPAWIRAVIDEREEAGRIYDAGETRQIVGKRSVAIRTGDAGAVYVSLNGGQATPLGASGAVVTQRFPREELPVAQSPTSPPPAEEAPKPVALAVPVPVPVPLPQPQSLPALQNASSGRPGSSTTPAVPTVSSVPPAPSPASAPAAAPSAQAGIRSEAPPGERGVAPTDLVLGGQRWLDAYHRRDRDAMDRMGAEGIRISDERSAAERFPLAQEGVRRELDQVELELTGDTAILTGRMTERAEGGTPGGAPLLSRVSQIWVRRAGRWHLADVRIVGEQRLGQLVR